MLGRLCERGRGAVLFPAGGAVMSCGAVPSVDGVPAPGPAVVADQSGGDLYGDRQLSVVLPLGDYLIIESAAGVLGIPVEQVLALGGVQYAHRAIVGVVCESSG